VKQMKKIPQRNSGKKRTVPSYVENKIKRRKTLIEQAQKRLQEGNNPKTETRRLRGFGIAKVLKKGIKIKVNLWVFGKKIAARVPAEKAEKIRLIIQNSQKAFEAAKELTVKKHVSSHLSKNMARRKAGQLLAGIVEKDFKKELKRICSAENIKTTSLESVAEELRKFYLEKAEIDLLKWKPAKKGR